MSLVEGINLLMTIPTCCARHSETTVEEIFKKEDGPWAQDEDDQHARD